MNNINHKYEVFAFRALDEPELCKQYISGHTKVLTDYGITNITSNNDSWIKNPNIYCLGLFSKSQELLGGIRIQLANGRDLLPIENAIGYMEKNIYNVIKKNALNGGIGELSGLWIDNRLKGLGVGVYMVRAAIASSNQLQFKTMIGICGDVTLKMFRNVGFRVDNSIGNNGQFHYPNENLIAHAVGILNAITLENAIDHDKKIMISLRQNNSQERIECDTKTKVYVKYNLTYQKVVDLNFYENVPSIKSIN